MQKLIGFKHISESTARILILGSMPGIKSIQAQEYYGNKHNAFWGIMSKILNFDIDLSYNARCCKLTENNIALWDVMKHCQRDGSLDSSIIEDSIEANDFESFISMHPDIHHIFFNGRKAEKSFMRYVLPLSNSRIKMTTLPSTSPAYASMRFVQKCDIWAELLNESLK